MLSADGGFGVADGVRGCFRDRADANVRPLLLLLRYSTRFSIRIAYVIPTLDQSGAERQLALLATHLPKADFDAHVVALNRGGFYADRLREAGIPVTVLQKRFRFDPLTYVRLRRVLRQLRPDVVQSFLFSANAYVRLPGVCPAKSAVIVSERCVDSWKSGWQLTVDRRLQSRMQAMTANSESVADFYRDEVGISGDKIFVIPNGIPEASAAGREAAKIDLRQQLGLPADAKLIGFAGRLANQKCLPDLLWGFHLIHQVVDNSYLVLIGDGPERDALAELSRSFDSRERVFFTGHRSDAANLVSQLDAFCLPSSFEGMSNSLMEAMSCGVPVVVSDIAANRELVTDGETGLMFPVGSGADICRALRRIFLETGLAETLGSAGQRLLRQRHSVQQLVERHVELYQRVAAGTGDGA